MPQYAADTSVSAEQSRVEIERVLQKYGADSFMYGWDQSRAIVMFRMRERQIRFVLQMPDKEAKEFWTTPSRGTKRAPEAAYRAWEQATRQRWRALKLVIQAKLEAVDANISEFDDEFLAQIVLPDGSTVSDFMRPQVDRAYAEAIMPSMLPALESGR